MVLKGELDGVRVLVLEDEFLIAMDVEQICADSGASAVRLLRGLPEADTVDVSEFDVALIDVMVNGGSSLPLAARLRATGVPVVFTSGYARTDAVFAGFAGAPVVGKPYSNEALVAAIRQALTGAP